MRSLISALVVGCCVGLSCADDPAATEPRPTDDELMEFYSEFCAYWEGCDDSAWETVGACADVQVAAYENLPTACLNRLIEYHRCVIRHECEHFNSPSPAEECRPLKDAIHEVDCAGMSAP